MMAAEHPFAELFREDKRTETQTLCCSSQNSCTIPTLSSIFTEWQSENEHHGCEYLGSWGLCRLRRVFSLCFSERGWKTEFTYVMKLFSDKYLVVNFLTFEIMLHLTQISSIFFRKLASWTFKASNIARIWYSHKNYVITHQSSRQYNRQLF